MPARVSILCSALLALAVASPTAAEDGAKDGGNFAGIAHLDITNAYFFRGILEEREGVIFQPRVELHYSLYESDTGLVRGITVGAGTWWSLHSERTLHTQDPQWVYEADYYPLLSIDFAGGVSLTAVYAFYTSPSDAFTDAQELNFELAWDDADVFGRFAVQPWMNLGVETANTAFGPEEGTGLQLGIAPTLYAASDERLTLTAPLEVGLSLEDYYEDSNGKNHAFGYASVGLRARIPLGFVPEGAGAWSLHLGAEYLFLAHILADANRGRSTYPVGTAGLRVEF